MTEHIQGGVLKVKVTLHIAGNEPLATKQSSEQLISSIKLVSGLLTTHFTSISEGRQISSSLKNAKQTKIKQLVAVRSGTGSPCPSSTARLENGVVSLAGVLLNLIRRMKTIG
jgi:hypothetical protein